MEKKIIEVYIKGGLENLQRDKIEIDTLIKWLLRVKEQKATYIDLWTTYGWEEKEVDLHAYYTYEESEEQAKNRIEREEAYKRQQEQEKLAREKALYLELKKKFEDQ